MSLNTCYPRRRLKAVAIFYILCLAFFVNNVEGGLFFVDGHGDIEVAYIPADPLNPLGAKALYPRWHIGAGSTVIGLSNVVDQEFAPAEITAVVPLASKFTNPGGATWAFLGASPGSDVFFLPQNNPPNTQIPFLGIASGEMDAREWNTLTWGITLPNNAPGAFSIFTNSVFGPNVLYSSILGPSNFQTSVGSHDHFNLAFTQPGFYDIGLTISGTHAADGFKESTGSFQFFVGDISSVPEPNSLAFVVSASFLCLSTFRRTRWC